MRPVQLAPASLRRSLRRARKRPLGLLAAALVLATAIYVVIGPLWVARYPLMTDLPFHTANAAVFRHYLDDAWHFREQFVLQPFAVPYLTTYLIAALLMTFTSAVTAMKVAAAVMLLLLPAGLAVLCHGMRKSSLLGVAGLGLAWCGLTSWGFVNFVGALGLFAMAIGIALRMVDRPRRGLGALLAALLVLLFVTHPFRFPFAVAAVVGAAVLTYPATGRARPVLVAVVGPVVLFAAWWWLRPAAVAGDFGELALHTERLSEVPRHLYTTLRGPAEHEAALAALRILAGVAAALGVVFVVEGRLRRLRRRQLWWGIASAAVVAGSAAVFLLMYLVLPMEIGIWWYVYPREITSASFMALALLPDLPRRSLLRLLAVACLCWAAIGLGRVQIEAHRSFDAATEDFAAIADELPQAPRLLYLVFDHGGAPTLNTPFIHLPAYVQAERGGWLSFHFAMWGASPVVYRPRREPGAVVPPPVPLRWEWTPQKFEVLRHGRWFDWFLVRSRSSPARRFAADPTIVTVAHEGTWWLFRRTPGEAQTPAM